MVTAVLMVLAVASLMASKGVVAGAWQAGSRLQALSAQVLVTGGMLSATSIISSRAFVQLATISLFIAAVSIGDVASLKKSTRKFLCAPRGSRLPLRNTNFPTLSVLALWLWLFTVNLWMVINEDASEALFRLVSGITLLVFLLTQRSNPIRPNHFYSAVLTSVCLVCLVLPIWPSSFISCSVFKCTAFGAILQGPFASGNTLGLSAAMCAALLFSTMKITRREAVVLLLLLIIMYATMSRTSFFAFGATVVLVAMDRFIATGRLKASSFDVVAKLTALCVALMPMLMSMYFVFTSEPSAFSNRGRIWRLAREAVGDDFLTGVGIDRWDLLKDQGYFGRQFDLFTHSEYLLLYFSGGMIALVVFAAILYKITLIAIVGRQSLARGAVVPLTFAVCGVIESLWNPLTIDSGTWLFFAVASVAFSVDFVPTKDVASGLNTASQIGRYRGPRALYSR